MDDIVDVAGRLALAEHEFNSLHGIHELQQLTQEQQTRYTQLPELIVSLKQQLESARNAASPSPLDSSIVHGVGSSQTELLTVLGAIKELASALTAGNRVNAPPANVPTVVNSLLCEMQKRAKLPECTGNNPTTIIAYLTEAQKFLAMPLIKNEPHSSVNTILAWGWKGDSGLFWSSMTEEEQQQQINNLDPVKFLIYFREQHFPAAVTESCVDQFVKIGQSKDERLAAFILRVKEMRRVLLLLGELFDDREVYRFYHSGLRVETKQFLAPGPKLDEAGLKPYFERVYKYDVDSHGVLHPDHLMRSSTANLVDAWMSAVDDDNALYVGNNQRRNVPWRSGDRNDKGEHPLCFKCAKRHAGGFAQCHAVAVSCDKCKKKDHLTQFHDNYVRVTAYNARFAKNAGTGAVSGSK